VTTAKPKKSRYKQIDGKNLIEIRVKQAQQLFDAIDPAPFRERDLDDDFAEYLIASSKEFPLHTPLRLNIFIDEPEGNITNDLIKESILSYFKFKFDRQKLELKTFLKRTPIFLFIGLVILVLCLLISKSLVDKNYESGLTFSSILKEGITIFGWVSLWKPIELLLFDWYPIYETQRFYKRLTEIEVHTIFKSINT
jgi:hypothetical protein